MEAEVLANKIFEIISLLKENDGVALFASHKSKKGKGFEKWLQVELSGILSNYGKVVPEKKHTVNSKKRSIDIIFNDEWAISLKDRKKRGKNVLDNLNELKEAPYDKYNKTCLVFLTFSPFGKKTTYDKKITSSLENNNRVYYKRDFNFKNTKFKYNNEGRLWFILG
jgi:hypothetical protein